MSAPLPWRPSGLAAPPQVWLADDSVVVDSGVVSEWRDVGSAGIHFSSTTTTRPAVLNDASIRGRQIVRFDGTDDRLLNSTAAGLAIMRNVTSGWAFAVYRKRSLDTVTGDRPIIWLPRGGSTAARFLLACSSGSTKNRPVVAGRRLDTDGFSGAAAPAEVTSTDWRMVYGIANYGVNSATLHLNGELITHATGVWGAGGATSNTSSTNPATIGASASGAAYTDIDLACLLIGTNSVPGDADIDRLFGWAAHRYGLAGQLPAGHAYKSSPPVVGPVVRPQGLLVRDEVSGIDAVFGTTQRRVDASTTVPQRARVTLLRQRDKRPVRRAWSDGVTGAFRFDGVNTARERYIALTEYPSNPDDPSAENYLRPVAGVSAKRGEGA